MTLTAPLLSARMDVYRAELAEWDALNDALRDLLDRCDKLDKQLAARERALEDALAVQAAQLKQIDALREQLAACQKPTPEPAPERAAFAVDPAFSADALPADRRVWRDRLLATFGAGCAYPDADANFAGTGSAAKDYAYALGYDQSVYVLACALDGTGDPALLAEITRRMALIDHARLAPANPLKESYVARLFAFYALLLHINGHADAGKWRDLTLARLNAGAGLWGNDALAQCCINTMLISHCLWRVTGDAAYQSYADTARSKFLLHFMFERTLWWHTLGGAQSIYGVQHANYARYDAVALLLLARLGFDVIALDELAARIAGMCRDDGTVAEKLDGTGTWSKGAKGWLISSYVLFGTMDGRISAFSANAWEQDGGRAMLPFLPAAHLSRRT